MSRSLALAVPVLLAMPVAGGLALTSSGHPPLIGPLLAGAVGWLVALVLRSPVGLAGLRLSGSTERTQRWVVASSGPLEESVRLAVLLLVGRDLSTALWIGFGWASIEVLYAIANGFALATLAHRTDPEAEQARAMLPPGVLSSSAPLWGIVERAWASGLHVGFTLMLAAVPLLVIVTAPLHTGVNVGAMWLMQRWPMVRVQALGLVVGATTLLVGFLLRA